jgi:glucokinase
MQADVRVVTDSTHPILVGDIGGTNARFALLRSGKMTAITTLKVSDYTGVAHAIAEFLKIGDSRPGDALLGVAGPVAADRCTLTNSSWVVDAHELCKQFGFATVRLINDFEAIAWSLSQLAPTDTIAIGGGTSAAGAPMAVLGPGTGLGLAYFLPGRGRLAVVETEGGHATLPATCAREYEVIEHLRRRFSHVSAERALSGSGLENLYDAIRTIEHIEAPDRSAADITKLALGGNCVASVAAVNMFCAMLGTVAGNVALTLGARGGVYVAGGIMPPIASYVMRSEFRDRFEEKGRFRAYMAAIPTKIITHADPAFIGLRVLAEQQFGVRSPRTRAISRKRFG